MKNHVKLGGLVLVLLAISLFLIFYQGPPPTGAPAADTDEHAGEEAGHADEAAQQAAQKTPPQAAAKTPAQTGETQVAQKPPSPAAPGSFTPQLPPAKGKRTRVRLETSMGDIEVILFDDLTPKTVKNFLDLTNKGYYKNMVWHRIVKGFVIQTGDPQGTGRGGPGYYFDNEIVPELRHNQPGVLAMANAGPNTNGSQFYITVGPQPNLDGSYSIFGQVVAGMDVARAINGVLADRMGRPFTPVQFKGVVVLGQE
jgi:cyclophilin family peptidyl-prolyl cis-trans isomerase